MLEGRMKCSLWPLGAAILLSAFAGSATMAESPTAHEVIRQLFNAFNRHDAAAMAALYDDRVTMTSTGFCQPRHGKAEAMRTYQALFDALPGVQDAILDE